MGPLKQKLPPGNPYMLQKPACKKYGTRQEMPQARSRKITPVSYIGKVFKTTGKKDFFYPPAFLNYSGTFVKIFSDYGFRRNRKAGSQI